MSCIITFMCVLCDPMADYWLIWRIQHTLIFGGGYKGGTMGIMRSLLRWADSVKQS